MPSVGVRFFFVFGVMLAVGKLSGELVARLGQPPVLGELVAGIALGASGLGVIPTDATDSLTPVVQLLSTVGVAVLLFETGLQTNVRALAGVAGAATAISVCGMLVPFGLGFAYWRWGGHGGASGGIDPSLTALFVGATLTATSVGVTARVLTDLKRLKTEEARLILGAAVIDDVLSLALLGVVTALAGGRTVALVGAAQHFTVAVAFLVVAVVVGLALAPRLFALVERMRVRGTVVVSAFAFLLLLAALADRAGSALILGAFAAGLILAATNQAPVIESQIKPVADIFVPIFFLSTGAALDVRALGPFDAPGLAVPVVLVAIALAGKLAAGWAAPWRRFNRWAVGLGMMPRGEVELIFANVGVATGALSPQLFGAMLLVVVATTLVTPPLLAWAFARWGST